MARRGSPMSTAASRSSPSTAAPPGCSSRICTSGRARSGCAASSCATTTSPASGSATATTTTATHGKSSATRATERAARFDPVAGRCGPAPSRRDRACHDDPSRCPRLARPHPRPARRRAPHGPRRLPDRTLLLDRVRARRAHPRADRRTPPRRRSLPLPHRPAPPRRPARAARPHRGPLHLADHRRRPFAAHRRRLGRGPADAHASPPRPPAQHHRHPPARQRPLPQRPSLPPRARRLLVSARSPSDLLYHRELATLATTDGLTIHTTFTREAPPRWTGFARRIDAEMLMAVGPAPGRRPRIYACGPTAFVERAADLLVGFGHEPLAIRLERFGATGG